MGIESKTPGTRSGRAASLIALALAASSCGCVHGEAAPNTAKNAPVGPNLGKVDGPTSSPMNTVKGGRVALDWQQAMLDRLAKDPAGYREAWGLFSEGGWANAGQVMIYGDGGQTKMQAVVVEPESDRVSTDRALSVAAFATIANAAKAAEQLVDLDMVAFDALTFEYVHAVKDSAAKVNVVKRVFVRNGGKKDMREYDALIAAFQQLRTIQK